jgi:hypothetical protein
MRQPNNLIKAIELKGNRSFQIYPDEGTDSPRDWDNFGRMICFHGRYNLGDNKNIKSSAFESWAELEKHLISEGAAVILPLYLYDHSGLTMRTSPFSCPWDSGQVGFIYCTREDIKKNWNVRKPTGRYLARAKCLLQSEVEIYDQYLRGDVYGFVLKQKTECKSCGHTEDEHLDSCWGYYGTDWAKNGILDSLDASDREVVLRELGGGK